MLGWNCAVSLPRALASVQDFAEIILADGGSIDGTREFAERHGVRIIDQTNPKHPITDFSKERNLLLDAATQPWFLWLDPDEYISEELHNEIRQICGSDAQYKAYRLRIERVDPDTLEPYVELRPNYQVRLFSMAAEPQYRNSVHERVVFGQNVAVETLNGSWCVPMERRTFAEYKHAVDARFPSLVADRPVRTLNQYMQKGVVRPLASILKTLMRALVIRVRKPLGHHIPWHIELGRMYTQWVIMKEYASRYLGSHVKQV